jgi:hypothetical protein
LEPAGRIDGRPVRLVQNEDIAFIGYYVLGMGFVLEPEHAQAWIDEDRRNGEVLFPYLNGEDLNSRPDCSPSRWVIDFYGRGREEASLFNKPYARVHALVRPERQKNKRAVRRDRWWQFAEAAPGLRKAIATLDEVLVIARISKTVMPLRVPNRWVFNEKTCVFATDSFVDQAVLSSSIHWNWVVKYTSTLETRVNYAPSDVFETFPRPRSTDGLAAVGRALDEERREIMLRRQLGLTKLYNLVNDPQLGDADDPDIMRLRRIHVELDQAVMAAYGWEEVPLDHGFHTYRQMTRWTVSPAARVEILDLLLAENLRRAAEQQPKPGKAKKAPTHAGNNDSQGTLL